MTTLTAGQLTYLRDTYPHWAKTYASPVPHVAILSARVNDPAIASGEEDIDYDSGTGTAGEYALIEAGQTFILGTSAGDDDLGRGRVMSITGDQTSGTLTVAWNSDVAWSNNMYLTVLLNYEVWPRFPRYTPAPAEDFWKDKTITYTDQNSDQYPVAISGSGYANWLGAGLTVTLHGNQSYVIASGAAISTYAWRVTHNIGGAAPVIAAAGNANTTITFDAAGLYWVRLTVTDDNGKSSWTIKPFLIHDDSFPPYYLESGLRVIDYEQGGVTFEMEVQQSATETEIPIKAPIVVWSESYYDSTEVSVSYLNANQYQDRTHIEFFGYVRDVSSDIGADSLGLVRINAYTAEFILRNKFEYPVGLVADSTITGAVDEWWKFPADEMTIARVLHHLWYWHSTLHWVADVFYPTSDTRLKRGSEELIEGSLYDRARFMSDEQGIFARPVCNKYGELWAMIDIQMEDEADRAAITDIFTITTQDWAEVLQIVSRDRIEVAQTFTSGFVWNGVAISAYCGKFGNVAANDGSTVLTQDNIVVSSLNNLLMLTGRLHHRANNKFEEITFQFAGNYSSVFDIAPQEWCRLTLSGSEPGNRRGITASNIRIVPRLVETNYTEYGTVKTAVGFEAEVFGRAGVERTCDDIPSVENPQEPSWTPPVVAAGVYGYWNGGYTGVAWPLTTDRINYSTGATAVNAPSAPTFGRQSHGGFSDITTYGYWLAGYNGTLLADTALAERITFSTGANALNAVSDRTVARRNAGGLSDASTYGYIAGGGNGVTEYTAADRTTFSTGVTAANVVSDFPVQREQFAPVSDATTYGYFCGGHRTQVGADETETVTRITFSTGVNAAFGNVLSIAAYWRGGTSDNTTYGYIIAGQSVALAYNVIADRITFSTGAIAANATSNSPNATREISGHSDGGTYGYLAGGVQSGLGYVAEAQRVTFATGVNAVNAVSDLSSGRSTNDSTGISDGAVH